MRFLLIVDDYLPGSIKIAARMMHDLALELINQGHEVSVCTPDDKLSSPFSREVYEGVEVLRFKSGRIKNVPKIKRAINETLLSFRAWHDLKQHFRANHYDIIVYYSPTIFFGPLVATLKRHWQCKSYLILRDIFPQWAVDNGLIKNNSLIHQYFKFFEMLNYDAADVIGVQSPSNLQYFQNDLRHKDKLDVLFNWSSLEDIKQKAPQYRDQLGLQGKVVFFYGGNIGHAQDMMNLVRLAKSLTDHPQAHFLFVGAGDEVALIEKAIKDGTNNITCLPSVDQVTYQAMLSEFDVGLFSLHKDHQTHNFPGKLLGYMQNSLPILGSVNAGNDVIEVLHEANAGFVCVNGDDAQLTEAALKLLYSADLRREMGCKSRKLLAKKFSVIEAAKKLAAFS
jgi:O26-antigen biosynthesis N-acetyl-L-fucosamine transferase